MNRISGNDLKLLKEKYPNTYEEQIKKINNNYPIQYLIGNVNFYGYTINTDERALIPRFETEYLVDDTIKLIKQYSIKPKIIDVGTGTGCISIALSKELDTHVEGLDISESALSLAKINIDNNKADVSLIHGDIKDYVFNKKYNVLISNPPYVSEDEIVDESIKYEPQNAIYAKEKGIEFYEIILKRSKEFLDKKNIIALEIGSKQKEIIKTIALNYYPNSKIICKKDLNGFDRYIYIINE